MSEQILFSLLRTGAAVAVTALTVGVVLKCCHCHSARIHRIAWAFVLLQGMIWFRVPLELPVLSPTVLTPDVQAIQTSASPEPPFTEEFPEQLLFGAETDAMLAEPVFESAEILKPLQAASVDPTTIILGIWLTGLAVVVLLRGFGLYRLLQQMRSAKQVGDNLLHDKKFRILLTDHFGPAIFRNTILVPETLWEESSETIRRGILKHELSHARHRDGLKSLLLSVVTMVHWFNPLAWFALKKFNEAAEWRCDSEAFGMEKNGLAVFAESMLALSRCEPKYLAWVRPYKNSDIKERVRRLKEQHLTAKESAMKKLGILCLVAVLFGFGLVKVQLVAQNTVPTHGEQPQNEPETVSPGPEPRSPAREMVDSDDVRQLLKRVRDSQLLLAQSRAELAILEETNRMHPGSISVLEIEKAKQKITAAELVHKQTKEEFKKTDENEPSPAGAPPKLEIHEMEGKFYLKIEAGEATVDVRDQKKTVHWSHLIEAAPLSSAPVPDMNESDYTIQSPAFKNVHKLGAALAALTKEEYEKLNPTLAQKHPAGGILIKSLVKGFRADEANLRPNDVIIGFDQWQMNILRDHLPFFTNQRSEQDMTMRLWVLRADKLYYVDIPVKGTKTEAPADGGFVTGGQPGVSGFTHLVTFKPKGDFNPRNPSQFLALFRMKLAQEGPVTGYFRTKSEGDKLVGSLCTGDPEGLKRIIESVPELEFVGSERLTKEWFEAYEKTKQESLPQVAADGGFATPIGFTHLVAVGAKGDFVPKTKTQFSREISRVFQGKSIGFGVVRSRVEDGKLILLELTRDPEGFKKVVDASDTLQYLRTERLTKDFYDKYVQDYDDAHFLPPDDGGFTWHGHRYIVAFRPKGNFNPKTWEDFNKECNKYMPWAFAGMPKMKPDGDRILMMQLTDDADVLKETMDQSPSFEFVSAERLTKEKFDEYMALPALSFAGGDWQRRIEGMQAALARLNEIRKTDWYQKLNRQQQKYVQMDENMFAYVYDPKNYEVGTARDEFEKKWIERLEGPEPGHPGRSALSVYDEAIIGLATIKSDKALPLLVKIACERVVKDNAHRHYATKALGMLGDSAAVPELIPLVYHFNWNTRFDAQVALVKLTGQNFGVDDNAWGEWYNENRDKLGKNLPEFDFTPVDWTCGSDDAELKKWADREEQKKMDAR